MRIFPFRVFVLLRSILIFFPIFHIRFLPYLLLVGPNAQGTPGGFLAVTQHQMCRMETLVVREEPRERSMNPSEVRDKPLMRRFSSAVIHSYSWCCFCEHVVKHVVKPHLREDQTWWAKREREPLTTWPNDADLQFDCWGSLAKTRHIHVTRNAE